MSFAFDTDREVVQCAVDTCWNPVADTMKFCVIPNTLEVAELWVSAKTHREETTDAPRGLTPPCAG